MTPKEKAKDLYITYIDYTFGSYNCKECCLILINELISVTGSAYWYEVKKEIQKIYEANTKIQ